MTNPTESIKPGKRDKGGVNETFSFSDRPPPPMPTKPRTDTHEVFEDPRVKALVEALRGAIASIEHADMSDGVCCCGDNMDNHSNPMDCGHSPTDAGEYHAYLVLKKARAAIAAWEAKRD